MKKLIAIIALCVLATACDNAPKSDDVVRRKCGGYDVEMKFNDDGDIIHAIISGDSIDLKMAVTASGAKYVGVLNDTDVALWGKGNDWILILDDNKLIECVAE